MLSAIPRALRQIYAGVAADIIRRGQHRAGYSARRAEESAISFFVMTNVATLWSAFLLSGGDPKAFSKPEQVVLAIVLVVALGALNRRLIRKWVLDKDGHLMPGLGDSRTSRLGLIVMLLGSLALVAVSAVI